MLAGELYTLLAKHIKVDPKTWWPDYGTFWVIIDSVLAQNTKFENVLKSRQNLKFYEADSLEYISNMSLRTLSILIRPSGLYNTKALRIKMLCKNICKNFKDFEDFKENVTAIWLKKQKGLGDESVFSILCYACERPVMVFDKYSATLLSYLGYEFNDYKEAKGFLQNALTQVNLKKIKLSEALFCAHFHALIVEFCKKHLEKGEFSSEAKKILKVLI